MHRQIRHITPIVEEILNQEYLKEILHYDPETGIFTWRVKKVYFLKVNDIAGYLDQGYRKIRINSKGYRAHRLAFLYMNGEFPPDQVDHINHVKDDNRWCNLRMVTSSENQRNLKMSKTNTSGFVGVSWHKGSKKWRVELLIKGKKKCFGLFKDINEAAKMRQQANIKYGFHPNHGK